jgi:hypothetical protein
MIMNEDETRAALIELKAFKPSAGNDWVNFQMQQIRSKGDGYWVPGFAVEHLQEIESEIIVG